MTGLNRRISLLGFIILSVWDASAWGNDFFLGGGALYGETILGNVTSGQNSVFRDVGYFAEGRLKLPIGSGQNSLDLFGRVESQTQKNISYSSQELNSIGGVGGADLNLSFLFGGIQFYSGKVTIHGIDVNGQTSTVDIYYTPIAARAGIRFLAGNFEIRAGAVYNLSQNSEISGMSGTFQPIRKWNGFLMLSIPLASSSKN